MVKLIPISTGLQVIFLLNAIGLAEASTYTTTEQCFTRYATAPPPRGTVRTVYRKSSAISTFTKTKSVTTRNTITPDPTTTVVTNTATDSTEVTQTTNTETFFTDVYTGVLSTVSTTDTLSTSASTTTTVTQTTNIPTVDGFVPLASDAAVITAGGGSRKRKRASNFGAEVLKDIDERSSHAQVQVMEIGDANPKNRNRYKIAVQCYQIVFGVKTVKATTTSTSHITLPPKTSTETATTTTTTTNTIAPPDATTTITNTHTTTDTTTSSFSTTVTTSTSTVTEQAPAVTSYDACMVDNRISKVGQAYVGQTSGQAADFNFNNPSEMDCCVQAQAGNYEGFQWVSGGNPYCILFKNPFGQCDPSSLSDWMFYTFTQPNGGLQVMGNGPCGRGTYGGQIA